ncbi:hypothetical protein [Hippea jasoniae]|uniref:hypothetical protein n=1 Tax=Hippea jasoniae TaxID=944479 RepID=UPI0005500FA2|nr:hypothetical protein [Hippea jasoniae]
MNDKPHDNIDIFWDYKKLSKKAKLQKIALFFPQVGRDKNTVIELYNMLDELDVPAANKKLIKLYYELIQKGELE